MSENESKGSCNTHGPYEVCGHTTESCPDTTAEKTEVELTENQDRTGGRLEKIRAAESLIEEYKELVRGVRETGKSSDPEYSKKREEAEAKIVGMVRELTEPDGVNFREDWISDPWKEKIEHLRRATVIAKEADELNFDLAGSPDKLIDEASKLIRDYTLYTEPVVRTGKSEDPNYSDREPAKKLLMKGLRQELVGRFGVSYDENWVSDPWQKGTELLRRSAALAKEAQAVNFDRSGETSELITKAARLIDDFVSYTEPVVRTGKSEDPNYTDQQQTKMLLIESLARELAIRLNIDSSLDVHSVRELSEKTGVKFGKAVRERYISYISKPLDREESAVLPQIGATGQWRTSSGHIEGKVVAGMINGPFVVETRYGKIQVNKIFKS